MGMMINRRRAYGGKKLPYDYEVEYLEGTGTQYIDTGIIPDLDDSISSIMYSPAGIFSTFFACCGPNKAAAWGVFRTEISWCGWFPPRYSDTLQGDFKYNGSEWTTITQNGSNYSLFGVSKRVKNYVDGLVSLYILARNNNGNASYISGSGVKLKTFSIKRNNILIIDLIPVVKDGVGYMYDNVSGKLFGNAGTGSFILGPDKGTAVTITQQQQREMYGE